jgi:hypothetical protein
MLWDGMSILRAEMLSTDTRHVQQYHDPPEQHIVQVDALSKSLLSFKNDADGHMRFVHWMRCKILCNLQQAEVNVADKAHG